MKNLININNNILEDKEEQKEEKPWIKERIKNLPFPKTINGAELQLVIFDPENIGDVKSEFIGNFADLAPEEHKKHLDEFHSSWNDKKLSFVEYQNDSKIAVVENLYSDDNYAKKAAAKNINQQLIDLVFASGIGGLVFATSKDNQLKFSITSRDKVPHKKLAQNICGYFDGNPKQLEFLKKYSLQEFVFSELLRELDEEFLKNASQKVNKKYLLGCLLHKGGIHGTNYQAVDNYIAFLPMIILSGITCEEIDQMRIKEQPVDFHEAITNNWFDLSQMKEILAAKGEVEMRFPNRAIVEYEDGKKIIYNEKGAIIGDGEKTIHLTDNNKGIKINYDDQGISYFDQLTKTEIKISFEEECKIKLVECETYKQKRILLGTVTEAIYCTWKRMNDNYHSQILNNRISEYDYGMENAHLIKGQYKISCKNYSSYPKEDNIGLIKRENNNQLNYWPLIEKWRGSDNYARLKDRINNFVVHPRSRVIDALSPTDRLWNDGLDEKRQKYGFQTVNPSTLYRLKSGPNKGKYLGGNIFNSDRQNYMVCEAPYSGEDYYRAVIDNKLKVLISLARPGKDNLNYRPDHPLNLHYIELNKTIAVDDYKISCLKESKINLNLEPVINATLKELQISKDNIIYKTHHIICEEWLELGGLTQPTNSSSFFINLIELIDQSLHQLSPANPYSLGIASNCKYGFGRSSTMVAMFEIYKQIKELIAENKNCDPRKVNIYDHPEIIKNIEVDELSFIAFLSYNIMAGAGEVHIPQIKDYIVEMKNRSKELGMMNEGLEINDIPQSNPLKPVMKESYNAPNWSVEI